MNYQDFAEQMKKTEKDNESSIQYMMDFTTRALSSGTLISEQVAEGKQMLEFLNKMLSELPMRKVIGNSYDIKDFIKEKGGRWNSMEKSWYVPSEYHADVMRKMNERKLSGQMWEDCRKCGQQPVYQSLSCLCERCGLV